MEIIRPELLTLTTGRPPCPAAPSALPLAHQISNLTLCSGSVFVRNAAPTVEACAAEASAREQVVRQDVGWEQRNRKMCEGVCVWGGWGLNKVPSRYHNMSGVCNKVWQASYMQEV
eukprot:351824-Chlamydomonas_euryale.AAC.6